MKTSKKAVGAAGITAGKASKYKKVKFDIDKIIAAYKSGTPVSQIAQSCGYPPNTGQNRVRTVLMKADPNYGKQPAKKSQKKKAAKAA
jgi:hypothetical protein